MPCVTMVVVQSTVSQPSVDWCLSELLKFPSAIRQAFFLIKILTTTLMID